VTAVADEVGQPTRIAWLSNDVLLYPRSDGALYRLNADGGRPEVFAKPPASADPSTPVRYSFPTVVPGGRAVLYTAGTGLTDRRIEERPSEGGAPTVVLENAGFPKISASGELLFVRDNRLMATLVNLSTWSVARAPIALAEDIGLPKDRGGSSFDF